MKLKIKREVLLNALNKVSKAISSKNLIPVLSGIKFKLDKKGLNLLASDNDITIEVFIPINKEDMTIEKEGSIIISGKYILDIIRKLNSEYINIEVVDELKIVVYTESSEFNLNGINQSEYPNINIELADNPIVINNKMLKTIVYQTSFVTSNDEARPILTGINLLINNKEIECNATDSYRLAKKVVKLSKKVDEAQNIVIPSKNINEFIKILDDNDSEVEIHVFTNKIVFKYDNILFQSRLINGSFPNTNNLFPTEYLLKIKFNINELYNVIDRASILTSDREKNVVTLETEGNQLTVRSQSAEIGRVEEKMTIEKDSKEDIKISFSAKYMMEALKSFDEEEVEISFVGEVKPIIIKKINKEDLIQLVLPIRTY